MTGVTRVFNVDGESLQEIMESIIGLYYEGHNEGFTTSKSGAGEKSVTHKKTVSDLTHEVEQA